MSSCSELQVLSSCFFRCSLKKLHHRLLVTFVLVKVCIFINIFGLTPQFIICSIFFSVLPIFLTPSYLHTYWPTTGIWIICKMGIIVSEGGHHKLEDKWISSILKAFKCIYDAFFVWDRLGGGDTRGEKRNENKREGEREGRVGGESERKKKKKDWSILSTGVAELSRRINPATYQWTRTFLPWWTS